VIAGPNGIGICSERVQLCTEILDEPRPSSAASTPTVEAPRADAPLWLQQAVRDLKRLLDGQEQLVLEKRAFERRYRALFARLIESIEAGRGSDAVST
jgi:hypothetical protein